MASGDEGKPEDDTETAETADGIGIRRARETLGDLVIRASVLNERIILTRSRKPAAAIVGMRDLERLRAMDEVEAA